MQKLSRRTLLRGLGTAIALPWLDAMMPSARQLAAATPATGTIPEVAPTRIAFMYIPNGVIGQHWFPKSTQPDFELPQSLVPLTEHRNDVNIISGLNRTYLSGEPHSQAASCWMTSALPNHRVDGHTAINMTLDQIIARNVGEHTPFSSLELSCNSFIDNLEPKLFDAISWYGPRHDARTENDPRRVFQRLFGKSVHIKRSVLDTVLDDAKGLQHQLGSNDRRKLEQYLDSIRAIEHSMTKQDESKGRIGPIDVEAPDDIPTNRAEYMRMMGDLMILALQTDQTRVASMMVGPERWSTPQLYEGVFDKPVRHHQMTHEDAHDEDVALIDRFHVTQYAYLIEKMKQIREGEGCLLDNTYFVLGSGIGDGNSHSYEQLPMIIAGKGGGAIKTGRHIKCSDGTPLANLWLTLGNQMGVEMNQFADSTGRLDQLLV